MFQTAQGVSIPFSERMQEQYQIFPNCIRFTPSFEKIKPMLLDFIEQIEEPLFIVLELPLNQDEEAALRTRDTDPFHKKVWYLDGQSRQNVLDILAQYGDILLNDGISQFSVASHVTNDDFFIQKYKLIDLFSTTPARFVPLFKKYGLSETSEILTPWDTFSSQHPGTVKRVAHGGKDIFDVHEALVALGMYEAKVLED